MSTKGYDRRISWFVSNKYLFIRLGILVATLRYVLGILVATSGTYWGYWLQLPIRTGDTGCNLGYVLGILVATSGTYWGFWLQPPVRKFSIRTAGNLIHSRTRIFPNKRYKRK
jgi:hypothetical protein